ncbi:MAG: hypothetical protein KDE31_00640 [Caldilineaceae bacterium]|nr:hypothetical protein [Caldilineaceae bacterium]
MKQKILFGTANQAKIDHVRAMTADWSVQILSPDQLDIALDVTEDGATVEENAIKKARAYAAVSQLPTFAIDAGLTIERFPPDQQPGVFVRRIHQQDHHVTDQTVLDYYRSALQECGGSTPGQWQIAVALATPRGQMQTESYTIETLFTAQPSPVTTPGAPLNALMVDPASGRYYSELHYTEQPGSHQLRDALVTLFQQFWSNQ